MPPSTRWQTSFLPTKRLPRSGRAATGRAVPLALLLGVLCAASPLRAAPCASTDECLRQIEEAQRETQSLRARFTQTKHMSLLNQPLVATGRFAYKRPDRVLWEIEQPEKATVIIADGKLNVPGLSARDREALAAMPVATAMSQITALFGGDVKALRQVFTTTAEHTESGINVHLVPQREAGQGMFSRIDLTFAEPVLILRTIRLENKLGDRVQVDLHEVIVNPSVPDSLFTAPTAAPQP